MINPSYTNSDTAMDVRVEFHPEFAGDFVYENEDGSIPLFSTMEFEDVNEVYDFVKEFETAIRDVNIYFRQNGKVVNLQDFTFEI